MKKYSFAPVYDPILNPFLKSLRRKILNVVIDLNPSGIIDVCCGTGFQVKLLNQNGFEAVGIDLSSEMLAVSRRGKSKAQCFKQDATALDFPDESFEVAMITLALHEKDAVSRHKIVSEMDRILQPGGHLFIADYCINSTSSWYSGKVINFVEFLAGVDHYKNFRNYIDLGGLNDLIPDTKYTSIRDYYFGGKSIILRILKKDPISIRN